MTRVRILRTVDDYYQLVDEQGVALGVGLFISERWARIYARDRRWFVVEPERGNVHPALFEGVES
jgi:hypothetical protein